MVGGSLQALSNQPPHLPTIQVSWSSVRLSANGQAHNYLFVANHVPWTAQGWVAEVPSLGLGVCE